MSDDSNPVVTVETNPSLTSEEIRKFWDTYEGAFKPISAANPCRQYFHESEFLDAMRRPEFVKLVGYEEDKMVFFAMGTNNLDIIPWINPEFYKDKLRDYTDLWFYVPVIYIPLTQQGIGYSGQLLRSIQTYMRGEGLSVVLFDHGAAPPNSELARIILRVPGTSQIGGEPIGMQLYQAVLTTPS